jgi:hypothetical protein
MDGGRGVKEKPKTRTSTKRTRQDNINGLTWEHKTDGTDGTDETVETPSGVPFFNQPQPQPLSLLGAVRERREHRNSAPEQWW